jgi:hypothetical protein
MSATRFAMPLVLSLALLLPTLMAQAEGEIDLSTPEAAIMTYCTAQDQETQNAVLCCGIMFDGPFIPDRDCTIVEIGPAHDDGAITADGPIRADDVEITTEVTERHPDKGDVRARYWYMLRNFNGEWKIIAWYYIPDENFPDIDT